MEVKKKRPRTFVRERVEGSSQEATERKHKRLKLDLETKCGKLATKLAKASKKLARLASGGNFSTKQLDGMDRMFVELRDIKELTTKLDAIRDFTSCVEHGRIFFYLFTEELQHTNRDVYARPSTIEFDEVVFQEEGGTFVGRGSIADSGQLKLRRMILCLEPEQVLDARAEFLLLLR